MSSIHASSTARLSAAEERQIDRICLRCEQAWKNSLPVSIEEALSEVEEPVRSFLLEELIALEVEYARLRGELPARIEYEQRFPTISPSFLQDLLKADGDSQRAPEGSSHAGALHCPFCRQTIENVKQESGQVVCPACGSSFRVHEVESAKTVIPGKTLGKFQLLDRVGVGAFGEVWRARDKELERTVAVKIPHASLVGGADTLALIPSRKKPAQIACRDEWFGSGHSEDQRIVLWSFSDHRALPGGHPARVCIGHGCCRAFSWL